MNPDVVHDGGASTYGQQIKPRNEIIKAIPRQAMFPAKTIKTEEEIDDYLEKVRIQMKQMLKNADGIKIN